MLQLTFADFALDVLKNIPATAALVESRFSLLSMMKSKFRTQLEIGKIRGMLLLHGEDDFNSPSLCFKDLFFKMKPWLREQGILKAVRKRRSKYKKPIVAGSLHASSDQMV